MIDKVWFDGIRRKNTIYVASVSRGKDSTAMLRAIQLMGWPLDEIVSVDVWATQDIPAELPPMVKFKSEWDAKCLDWFGVPATRVCATKRGAQTGGDYPQRDCYEDYFYRKRHAGNYIGSNVGFPMQRCPWCNKLKTEGVDLRGHILSAYPNSSPENAGGRGAKINIVYYVGIAADEPNRIVRHIDKPDKVLPLVQIGWDEELCGLEAQYMDMLSPTYDGAFRDGCWFCHNQGVDQLRSLRKNYPDLWAILLKWDKDSPVAFRADGHTVHDFDRRFALEGEGKVPTDRKFRWRMIDECVSSR